MDEPFEVRVARVVRALHDSDCANGSACTEELTTEGRYGRVAVAALAELSGKAPVTANPFADPLSER